MGHLKADTVQRFVKGEILSKERNEAVRHLLAQCPQCARLARSTAGAGPGERKKLDPIFDRLGIRQKEITERLQLERSSAAGQWASLQKHSPARRPAWIGANPQMHTWGLYDTLLEAARRTASKKPEKASEVAGLALVVAMSLDKRIYGEERIADFKAAALAVRGNCKRIAQDFAGARADLEAAWELLEMGTGDALERAHVLRLGGAWNLNLGYLEKAEELLRKALNVYLRAGYDSMAGRALISQAQAIGSCDPERAIQLLTEASRYIDSIKEPWIELCRRHDLAWYLNEAGRPMAAAEVLAASRRLYRKFRDPGIQAQLHWLEGRIHHSLGDHRKAERLLERAATNCLKRGLRQKYFFCSLDLATIVYARGNRTLALQICSHLYSMLDLWHMHTEKLAVLLFINSLR
jgi:tetratricopeptide (TPR) repeat protein